MKEESKWYVVHTKIKLERKTAELLEKKQISVYLPEYNKVQYLHGREKKVKVHLLPSLFFAFLNENQLENIKKVNGVIGVLYKMHKPAVIKSKEILAMQYFLTHHDEIFVDKIPLDSYSEQNTTALGNVENLQVDTPYDTEKLYLPSLGYKLSAKTQEVFAINVA